MTGYFGSFSLWREKVGEVLSASPEDFRRKERRELTRTLISSRKGNVLTLTVPIAGGARHARALPPEKWIVADHGRWTDVHLGALDAAYGSTPYFPHFFPSLAEIISNAPGLTFTGLCRQIDDWTGNIISLPSLMDSLMEMNCRNPLLLRARGKALERMIDPRLSIADSLFRFGPETIFPLVSALYDE